MKTVNKKARMVVVDDHPMMRDGLSMRITSQPDWGSLRSGSDRRRGCCHHRRAISDLVLVDISLKSGNGIELIKRVRSKNPCVKFLAISAYKESLYEERALRAGAMGYMNKQNRTKNSLMRFARFSGESVFSAKS